VYGPPTGPLQSGFVDGVTPSAFVRFVGPLNASAPLVAPKRTAAQTADGADDDAAECEYES
jgi:hypothetical protein